MKHVYIFLTGGCVFRLGFHSRIFLGREIFGGGGLFRGNLTLGGWDRFSVRNYFWLPYFLFASSILHGEMSRGNYFRCIWISGEKSQLTGEFPEWSRNQLEIKVFSKWKHAKKNFTVWFVCEKFYRLGGGRFSVKMELSGENFTGRNVFYIGGKFPRRSFLWGGGVYFIEGESYFLA